MKFQLYINGSEGGFPPRDDWFEAAMDATQSGQAVRSAEGVITFREGVAVYAIPELAFGMGLARALAHPYNPLEEPERRKNNMRFIGNDEYTTAIFWLKWLAVLQAAQIGLFFSLIIWANR